MTDRRYTADRDGPSLAVVRDHDSLGDFKTRLNAQRVTNNLGERAGRPVVPQTVTAEAEDDVYGDRQTSYGHPRQDFTRAATIATGLLGHKLAEGEHISAADIGRLMIGVKLARDVHTPKRDNRVDIAGYALTLDRLETGR